MIDKRAPKHLTADDQERFLKLQAKWDTKLKNAGFKDIEQGSDLNDFDALTVSSATTHQQDNTRHRPRRATHVSYDHVTTSHNPNGSDNDINELTIRTDCNELRSLATADTFRYWAVFLDNVEALPTNYHRRGYLREVGQTGIIVTPERLKRYRLNARAGYATVDRFCRRVGLPRPHAHKEDSHIREAVEPPAPAIKVSVDVASREIGPRTISPSALAYRRSKGACQRK